MPLVRGSSGFESLILSHHSRFTCECNQEEIDEDDDDYHTPPSEPSPLDLPLGCQTFFFFFTLKPRVE